MLLTLFLIVAIISFFGTLIIIKVAVKRNILDIPNIRSSHSDPTPRLGGVAIVMAWYVGLVGLKLLNLIELHLFCALMIGIILAVVSYIDDIYDIKPGIRIIFQLITVLLGFYFIGGLKAVYINDAVYEYHVILTCIAVVGAIWFINLYNFLDGIDGYAGSEAVLISLGLFLIVNNGIFFLLIFALSGFMIWNWPKAKIFMGDVGSTQLGYILVILGINYNNDLKISILGWLILTSLFWVDASLTLFKRWRNHEKLSTAHKKHYYQRIVQYGYSHKKVVLISIILNLILISLVFLSERLHVSYFFTFMACLIINMIIAKFIDNRFPF